MSLLRTNICQSIAKGYDKSVVISAFARAWTIFRVGERNKQASFFMFVADPLVTSSFAPQNKDRSCDSDVATALVQSETIFIMVNQPARDIVRI